jgi:hypothetical protein
MVLVQHLYMFNCDILFFCGHFLPFEDPPADYATDYRPNQQAKVGTGGIGHVLTIASKLWNTSPQSEENWH